MRANTFHQQSSLLSIGTTLLLASSAVLAAPGLAPQRAANPIGIASPIERRDQNQCSVHVAQYLKNEGPGASGPQNVGSNSDYRFDIYVFDDQHNPLGSAQLQDAPDGQAVEVSNPNQYSLLVTANTVDSAPVSFAFGNENWDSSSSQCSVGGYDNSGVRNMDCTFSCYESVM